jgi:hypothetical protein
MPPKLPPRRCFQYGSPQFVAVAPLLDFGLQPTHGASAQAHWLRESALGNAKVNCATRKPCASLHIRKS